jgi:hypothetical protein
MKKNTAIFVILMSLWVVSCNKDHNSDVYDDGEKIEKITFSKSLCATSNCSGLYVVLTSDSVLVIKPKYDAMGNDISSVCTRAITQDEWLSILPNKIDPFFSQSLNHEAPWCGTGIDLIGLNIKTTVREDLFTWESNPEGASKGISNKIEDVFGDFIDDCQ